MLTGTQHEQVHQRGIGTAVDVLITVLLYRGSMVAAAGYLVQAPKQHRIGFNYLSVLLNNRIDRILFLMCVGEGGAINECLRGWLTYMSGYNTK